MCKEIPLSRNAVALVDAHDYPRVSQYKWSLDGNGYVTRMEPCLVNGEKKRRKIMLHRFILNAPDGLEVDHRFGNKLDNRRSEIRIATRAQNNANRGPKKGKYKGVSWHKRDQVWRATIVIDGKHYHLGSFRTPEDAARRYDKAAYAAWGDFAYINLPDDLQPALAPISS